MERCASAPLYLHGLCAGCAIAGAVWPVHGQGRIAGHGRPCACQRQCRRHLYAESGRAEVAALGQGKAPLRATVYFVTVQWDDVPQEIEKHGNVTKTSYK